jgi:hypothetical protein
MLSGKTSVLGNRLWAAASQMKVRKRVIRRRPQLRYANTIALSLVAS